MEYTTLYDILVCFLRKHNALERYVQNLRTTLVSICRAYSKRPYEVMTGPFRWTRTVEGFAYWDELDTEWRDLLSKLI